MGKGDGMMAEVFWFFSLFILSVIVSVRCHLCEWGNVGLMIWISLPNA